MFATDPCPASRPKCGDFSWCQAAQTCPCWRHSRGPGGWVLSLSPRAPRYAPPVDAAPAFPSSSSWQQQQGPAADGLSGKTFLLRIS